jgi:hypothetical protein
MTDIGAAFEWGIRYDHWVLIPALRRAQMTAYIIVKSLREGYSMEKASEKARKGPANRYDKVVGEVR